MESDIWLVDPDLLPIVFADRVEESQLGLGIGQLETMTRDEIINLITTHFYGDRVKDKLTTHILQQTGRSSGDALAHVELIMYPVGMSLQDAELFISPKRAGTVIK